MQTVSAAFIAAMENAPYIARLTLDGTDTIQGNVVPKFTFSGGSNANEDGITLGTTVASAVTITLEKEDVACALEGRELFLEIGIEIGSDIEWLPVGTFKVTDAAEDDGNLIVKASDALSSKFDVEYEPIEEYDFDAETGVDSLDFLTALCSRQGVEVDTSGLESIPLKSSPEGYTERQIIGFIAALHGGFANIDRNGVLRIRWYEAVDYTVDPDAYYASGMEKASFDFTVGWVKCYVEPMAETLAAGDTSAEQGIYFECPWMTEDILAGIWTKVQGFTYRPVTELRFFGDPRIDPWDIITMEDLGGTSHSVPVMAISHEYDGGIISRITASGQTRTEAYEGPVQRETKRLYSQILKKQNEINLAIKSFDGNMIISMINLSETTATIQAPKIKFEGLVTANSNFKILTDGSIEATNAVISGKITATGGTIGKWNINSNKMYAGDGVDILTAVVAAPRADNTYVFAAGGKSHDSYGDCPFRVTKTGKLYATDAEITGKVTAESGDIGGWTIATNGLYRVASDGQIRLIPAGNLSQNYTVNGYSTKTWVMLCGPDNTTTANFGVTAAGKLYAKDANLSGTINATGGKIGNWTVSSDGYLEGTGGANTIRLYPKGVAYSGYTFYLVVYDSGGAVPVGGITASGWKTL